MNFRDPELILVKRFRGGKKSYFQVNSFDTECVSLQDIEHGECFCFKRAQLESHINSGLLIATVKNNVPDVLFINAVKKKTKPVAVGKKAANEMEVERRYFYVHKVLDSDLPALSANRLTPWISKVAAEIEDESPPSYKTLTRWLKAFNESGWKKASLLSRHHNKGNHSNRLPPEVDQLLSQVIVEHARSSVRVNIGKAHRDFIERMERLNERRCNEGLPMLTPSSYETTLQRFRK
ncbi:helix-turn-helix domain-containing protein [Vibrio sp. 10N.286.52.C3]|uniref:helix-turn-helix domain-containing protein n=1 Tax=unclassified Vibrio TaxID=2614977 RepID=UPI0010BE1BCC|nr:helix-turn-helix domain-containing protein [Vibrio sp. F13]TKF72361.1 helix-turn-helix domain-containing protein [Vibrio sp. F13]